MTGFAVYNNAGALTVNSDFKSPMYTGAPVAIALQPNTSGALGYNLATPFGNMDELSSMAQSMYPTPGVLSWFKIPAGHWCFPGNWMFRSGATRVTTNNTQKVTSGYLDVYSSNGTLIWSAVSAAKMPRVLGYLDVPPNFDLEGATRSFTVPANVYFPMNCFPGNLSDDGVTVGYNGIILKMANATTVQLRWITQNQRKWAETLKPVGLRIPYCVFPGI